MEKSIDHMSRQGIYIIFVCSSIMISFRKLYTYVLWYWHTREEHHSMVGGMGGGGKAPLVPHSQYIFCKYVIEDGQNPQPL